MSIYARLSVTAQISKSTQTGTPSRMQSGVQGGGCKFKRGAKKGCKGDASTFKGVREVRTTLKSS